MQNDKLNYTVVGVFVIAMLAAAVGTAVALTGRGGAHDHYAVLFDNVADVKYGTQVRFEGFAVGQVEEIRPVQRNGETLFDLDISVRKGWAIPADSVASIGSSTFLGAKTVEIRRGKSSARLSPGAHIKSAPPADMFSAMSSIAGEFGDLSRNGLRPLLARMAGLVTTADRLLQHDLGRFLGSLNGLTSELQDQVPQVAAKLVDITNSLNITLGSAQKLLSDDNVGRVGNVVHNVEQVSGKFLAISNSLQGTLRQVNALVGEIDGIVKSNKGNVSAALKDTRYLLSSMARNIDSITHNFAGTARNMNEFSRLIRQNPGLLLNGAPPDEVKADAASGRVSDRGSR